MIKLIINADDFGYSKVFNEKILDLLERGIIKSTTVMVNRINERQKEQIKKLSRIAKSQKISVGLHLEFIIEMPIKQQIESQYEKFISIFEAPPSHLDIHKLIDNSKIINAVNEFAKEKNLPVRNHGILSGTKQTTNTAFFCKNWASDIGQIKAYLKDQKDGSTCELITHPGDYDPESKSTLNKERLTDYLTLMELDKWIKTQKNIKVISYLEL
jgi:predicted glycoside hydrolase/deacetylase ChbG (UPF0249 family)